MEAFTITAVGDRLITENALVFAFPTNIPIVPGHVLICPKRVVETIYELTPDELLAIRAMAARLRSALQRVFKAEGFNYAWNEGRGAGQTIPHVHLHMLPRSPGDSGIVSYEPRSFLYRPGSRAENASEELGAVAKEVRMALEGI